MASPSWGPPIAAAGCNPANAGNGRGISTVGTQFNITIRNGTIQGLGNVGILLAGDSDLVEYMHVRSNGGGAIWVEQSVDNGGSIIQRNTVQRNGGVFAILLDRGVVDHDTVDVNVSGINVSVGTISHNVVTRNLLYSLYIGGLGNTPVGGYLGNLLNGNGADVPVMPFGDWVNVGQNVCGTVICPGAQF